MASASSPFPHMDEALKEASPRELTTAPILVVDDDESVLHVLEEQLKWEGYRVVAVTNPKAALELLTTTEFSVIICDQVMPEITGLDFLAKARELRPTTSRMLITGVLSLDTMIEAINRGEIFRFIGKPWLRAELLATVKNAVNRYELQDANQRLHNEATRLNEKLFAANSELQSKVAELEEQKRALDFANGALQTNFEHSLELCYRITNTFYPLIGQHTKAVVDICRRMAETEHFTDEEKHVLTVSAWLHDIGLVGFQRDLLHKNFSHPETLTKDEMTLLKSHPAYGQTLASFVDDLRAVGETIRAHHEQFDGKGYPDGLAGETIPWTARCLAVAVYYIESNIPPQQTVELIVRESGKRFDPEAVRLFFKVTQIAELPKTVREIMIEELAPGMRLAKGIYSPSGLLLVAEGQDLSSATISKIKNHNMLTSVTQRLLVYS
jgi:response regulator RpfG family c-di-GMP phosphodiesterase